MNFPTTLSRISRWLGLVAAVQMAALTAAAAVTLQFNTNQMNQLRVAAETDGSLSFVSEGTDPFVMLRPFDRDAAGAVSTVLAFDYFCPDGIDGVDVYYGPPITAAGVLSAGSLAKSESWQPFSVNLQDASQGQWTPRANLLRLDWGKQAGKSLRVRNLVLRAPNEAEKRSQAERELIRAGKQAKADVVTRYLAAELPARIEAVAVDRQKIQITGRLLKELTGELHLIEAQPWHELWKGDIPVAPSKPDSWIQPSTSNSSRGSITPVATISLKGDQFEVSVPRFDGERDRITSRWAVVAKEPGDSWRLVSHYVYPTDLAAACLHPELDRKTADGLKGMGGVWANNILDELVELGVKHITDNMWISNLLSETEQAGWHAFRHNGRNWWANPRVVDGHDRLIKFATGHGMVVSAIVLVGFGNNGFAGTLQHPEADRAGQYAMPNLTTAEGAAAYEAAIHFLAQRYAQPGDPHGRISNWILHNEVDYGWEWTNMGAQPLPVYLDTYLRSMRIVHNLARQFNPHARTFISLTHRWRQPDDPAWKTYAPRRMLELLAQFSRVEGDFEWGVAYHPYPQSLFKSDAWNDTLPTADFNTPLITPKNIAVFDRWMQRDEMRFAGRIRGVILSEQGFHTNDYGEASERLQAAAFVYMWRQMRGLKTIEAFHNHRWIDHPAEGGLKLGIRTLPTEGKPYGDRKFAWEIYRALETPGEADAVRFADELIGADQPGGAR